MKKIKHQYRHPIEHTLVIRRRIHRWIDYPNLRTRYHKRFSTKQEKQQYVAHLPLTREYPLKLRARRGLALPDAWDDLPSDAVKLGKCWKNATKRRKQYYR